MGWCDEVVDVLPVRISFNPRFIARHITRVRRSPDAPTIPPTDTSNRSFTAMPAMAPATPLNELSNEMVMGISAPPTRTANAIPKKELIRMLMIRMITVDSVESVSPANPVRRMVPARIMRLALSRNV